MSGAPGWEGWSAPVAGPAEARPVAAVAPVSPFTRLARVHALVMGGDAVVAVALAGSLFFSISPDAAQGQVARYLLLTMAPFAIVAPLLGPAIDRVAGGRRLMIVACAAGRVAVALLMMFHLESLLLFPAALAFLVLSKAHSVAKAALVPSVVSNQAELVEANAKLSIIASVAAFAGGVPGAVVGLVAPQATLALAALVFSAGTASALRLPPTRVAVAAPTVTETAELRSAGVLLAASAMAMVRASVGFFTFQIAFWFRRSDEPTWWFGIVIVSSAAGTLLGASFAPRLRQRVREERILTGVLVGVAIAGAGAALAAGTVSSAVLAVALGAAAAMAKLAFDSIVQRDAPDANQGRAFARFETRFQLAWVLAGFIPVVVKVPGWLGFFLIGALGATAAVSYLVGTRQVARTGVPRAPLGQRARAELRRRASERANRAPHGLPLPPPGPPPGGTDPPLEVAAPPAARATASRSPFRRRARSAPEQPSS